jgi:glycosyltransferase involved in cell wall biosynthesis
MRLLMLTPSLPYPPQSGGSLRAFGILSSLHSAGHEVSLLSFDDGTPQPADSPLPQLCKRIITLPPPVRGKLARLRHLLFSGQADLVQRMYSQAMTDTLTHACQSRDYDVIQFEGLEMAVYLPAAAALAPRPKLIYDAFNAEYALQKLIAEVDARTPRRWLPAVYSSIQARRIYALERDICQRADGVIAVSPEDEALLRPLRGSRPLFIVPSGIFTREYTPPDHAQQDPVTLVFTGKMDYRPNVDAATWFAEAIFPRIRAHIANAQFVIVGQQPGAAISALAEQPAITITGRVPAVPLYLHRASVYVAPLRMGSGTRLKLLEAMAAGCAIVATTIAASGMNEATKAVLIIADDEATFASAVIALLHDPLKRRSLGEQAQAVVRAHYDWAALTPRLMQVYEDTGGG